MPLRVRDLTVARGGWPVLEGVSFDLADGAALILRGPNGIGKTTLLRTIAGLQPPVAGTIDGAGDSIAYASHADGIKDALSVEESLDFWARIHGRGVPDEVYARFALEGLRRRSAGTLSSGQRRRLGLARLAVVNRPILLLDEPTISLDRQSVSRFAGFLRDGHLADGGSALIATHIDLGLEAPVLELAPYAAEPGSPVGGSDEAFL